MKARLIAPVAALLCALPIVAGPGQTFDNIKVFDGPTPFVRFVQTQVSVVGFGFAQFQIEPKKGSATRPIKVRWRDLIWKRRVILIPKMAI